MALLASVIADTSCPFIGLRPFDESDSHRFYGRDHQVDELLRRLAQARFLAVIGTSGCGKSSLVRAGLIPSLKRGFLSDAGTRWKVAVMRPGNDPFGALAHELDKPTVLGPRDDRLGTLQRSSLGCVECVRPDLGEKESLLLVVDQFEEIFRYRKEAQGAGADDQADAFVRLLLASAEQDEVPVFVVLTMRSDYLGDCAVFRGLPEALNDAQYLVPVLTRPQLREVVEAPVASAGAEIAPELVQRVLNDVGHGLEQELDQLPVLQHALMRTWQESAGVSSIELEHYGRAGRMSGALNQHAKQLYQELSEEQQATAKRVFQRLTEKETAGRDIRRPTSFGELREVTGASSEELTHIVEHFRDFLYSSDEPSLNDRSMIDITHEALIRQWGDLKGWAGEEAHSAEVYGRLARDAGRKARKWGDPDLAEALRLREAARWNDTWAQRYTPGAFSYSQAEKFLEDSRRHRLWRKVQRLGLMLLPVAIAALWYWYTVDQERQAAELARKDAEIEQIRAQAGAKAAQADRLIAQAQTASAADKERLLAEAAQRRDESRKLAASAQNYQTLTQQREAEFAQLRSSHNELQGRFEDAEKGVAALTARLSTAEQESASLSHDKTDLEGKLAAAEKENADLTANLAIVEREKTALAQALRQVALEPGTLKVNPDDGLNYVWIAPGEFAMGCSPGDRECFDNEGEKPHTVMITKGFWLGQTEVTVGAYRRFAGKTQGIEMPGEPMIGDRNLNPGWRDQQQPIVKVTWQDAKTYCEGWAKGRLPTEAEWEYAARARNKTARHGDLDDIAWYADNSGPRRLDSTKAWNVEAGQDRAKYRSILEENGNRIHRVQQKNPNGWRLYDMLGNVFEWVADWYQHDYYQTLKTPAVDPPGPTSESHRVLRGGSWDIVPWYVRASYRTRFQPEYGYDFIGFRCAREVIP